MAMLASLGKALAIVLNEFRKIQELVAISIVDAGFAM